MRTTKELYQLVLESLEKGDKGADYNDSGICGEIDDLYYLDDILSQEEYRFLYNDVKYYNPAKNPLPIFKKYKRSKFYEKGCDWWFGKMYKNKGSRNARIRLVKDIIKSL